VFKVDAQVTGYRRSSSPQFSIGTFPQRFRPLNEILKVSYKEALRYLAAEFEHSEVITVGKGKRVPFEAGEDWERGIFDFLKASRGKTSSERRRVVLRGGDNLIDSGAERLP
jgi:hypothetical protein